MIEWELLGDQGVLARLSDEAQASVWATAVRRLEAGWVLDVVQSYTTVAVFHDPERLRLPEALRRLRELDPSSSTGVDSASRLHRIPCCYALGPDLARVAHQARLDPDEVVRLHSSVDYSVFAIGFCPGFPYLGYLPPPLCGTPRLDTPRLRVEPGSVGLTGRQTGIYPEPRPGGWNLIGRTPLVLVDVAMGHFPLRTGDLVRFVPIPEVEFARLQGQRLEQE